MSAFAACIAAATANGNTDCRSHTNACTGRLKQRRQRIGDIDSGQPYVANTAADKKAVHDRIKSRKCESSHRGKHLFKKLLDHDKLPVFC